MVAENILHRYMIIPPVISRPGGEVDDVDVRIGGGTADSDELSGQPEDQVELIAYLAAFRPPELAS